MSDEINKITTIKLCKGCGTKPSIPRYNYCNQCRLKAKLDPNKTYCSDCHKEMVGKSMFKTCDKCRIRAKGNRVIIKKVKTMCLWKNTDIPEDKCKNLVFQKNYCKKHYEEFYEIKKNELTDELDGIINELKYEKEIEEIDKVDSMKLELLKDIKKLIGFSQEKINQINKDFELKEFKKEYTKEYYINKIFNVNNWDDPDLINKLELELEIIPRNEECYTQEDRKLVHELNHFWEYFRIHSSSIRTRKCPGRMMRIFIKDKKTEKYLGILSIGSPVYNTNAIDKAIGWDTENKKKYIGTHIMNINCCVGLRPISFNTNIGKLLAMAAFSKEIQEEFNRRYNNYIACYMTFSIYGKSIQYDKLECLKMLKEDDGLTKGQGCDIPDYIYNKGMEYLKAIGYDFSGGSVASNSRLRKTRMLFKELELSDIFYYNNEQRGIYMGYTSNVSQKLLTGALSNEEVEKFIPDIKPFAEIVEIWKNKWAIPRLKRLIETNTYKTEVEIYELLTRKEKLLEYNKAYQERLLKKFGEANYNALKAAYREEWKILKFFEDNDELHIADMSSDYKGYNLDLSAKYLGGLFDGDGSFVIYKQPDGSGFNINIVFAQSVVNILEILQHNFGGYIYKGRKNINQRQQYSWRITGENCRKLLEKLHEGCILKYEQTKIFMDFLTLINLKDSFNLKYLLYQKLRQLNAKVIKNIQKPYDRVDMEYITGILDAEGCIMINKTLKTFRITISQKGDRELLNKIKTFLGIGEVYTYIWSCGHQDIKQIVEQIEKKSIIKKEQLKCLISYLDTYPFVKRGYSMDPEIRNIRQLCYDIIQDEKHNSIDIDKASIDASNKLNKINTSKLKILDDIEETNKFKDALKEEFKQINNDKKQLSNKTHTNIHNLNMSKSNIGIKRTLTDDQIRDVIQLRKDGKSYQEIQDKYAITKSVVENVLKGIVKPMDEVTDQDYFDKKAKKAEFKNITENMSDEEYKIYFAKLTSIGKRKLDVSTMIEILLMKDKTYLNDKGQIKKWFSTTVAQHFNEHGNNLVTNDIVKNIWSGRTKLYHDEHFDEFKDQPITYDEYLKIIK
jgi:hypothetical protein